MAKFKLYLLTFQNNINEKNQLSNKYLANLISEFTSQVSTKTISGDNREHFIYNTNNSFCYTYDEQLSLHQNSQKELTFKMDFRVYRDDRLEDNPYAQNLIIGSQLLLEDAYGQQHLFTVKNINIELSNVNTVCTYSCQDSFTFQLSKQNDGYEITNDIEDEDFIGAHTIDWWVQKKIVPECFIYYQYIPLAEKGYTDDYYKQTIPFSGSGTADSILISLGETLDLNLHVYEHFDETDGALIQQFWFEPSKNPEVSGLSYSPYANLQNLSLTHNGDSLTSVLNVYGGTFGDERITLLPTIPMLFKKVFASDEWMKTPYYQGMFNDIVYGQTIKINLDDIGEEFVYKIVYKEDNNEIPEYIAIDFSKIIDITSFKWLNYYDYYKFTNINNSSWATIGYTGEANYIIHSAITKQWLLGSKDKLYNSYEEFYKAIQDKNKDIYLYIPIAKGQEPRLPKKEDGTPDKTPPLKTALSGIFYLSFYRQPSEDETMFATVAEQCPWLENKLLDFSYFINHNLLNSYEYGILIQQIYNNLRQINGRLIYLADSYYKALSEKTKFLAQLDERVTNLGAKFAAEFLQPYLNQKQIREEDVQDFLLDYKTLYAVPEAKRAIFNYDEIYSSYINKYLSAEQRFLKNIYDFRDYWNAPVTIEGAQTIYCYTAYPSSGYSFSENQYSTRNFKNYNTTTFKPNTTIFDAKTNKPVDIVYSGNYNQFKWAKYAENTFIKCSEANKNNIYDREKTYYKQISISTEEGEAISYQPLKLDELKTNFLINSLGKNEEITNYYFKNRENYLYGFLNLNQISNFYDKFTSKALLKIVNYNLLSDQDDLTEHQIKEWLEGPRTLTTRTLLGLKIYNYLYTTTFPLQEVYNYEDVYQLEGGKYVLQNIGKKYQAIPIVNASNYMNFYKRVSVSNEEYKTSQTLTTIAGVSTAISFISASLGSVGWIVTGVSALTATICGAIACNKVSNKNTWWSNDGYTNKDITLKYTLPNQGLYNKLIQYDDIQYANNSIILNAKHFYYTTSEKDYDNYKAWNAQGYADLYFNKYSKFIPNYHYIQQNAAANKYMYKPSYLRLVKPNEYVNSTDEYLMLMYDTTEANDLHYFTGIFEDAFKTYIDSKNRINNVHYSLFEQLSDSFSFNDFGDISNKTLQQVLEKQFVFDTTNPKEFSLKLNDSTYYILIFHKEDYTVETIKKASLEADLAKYQYVFYNSENDEAFDPNHTDNFVTGLYLPASEDSLTPDDLEDAKAFDSERLYYKIENDKVIYYPTITQVIQQGNSYYYYKESSNLIWRTAKLAETSTIPLEVYDQTQQKFVQKDFTVYNKYESFHENQIVLSSTISLNNLTNGLFWSQYTNISDKNLTFLKEHAMIIETDLTNYWNQAYNASQLCQYFIPEHWQSYYDNQVNPFVLFTLPEAEIRTVAKDDVDAITILKIFLTNDYDEQKPMTDDYLKQIYKNKKEGLPLYILFHGYYYIVNYNESAPEGSKYTMTTLDSNLSNLLFNTYPNAEIAKIDYYNTAEGDSFIPQENPSETQYFQQNGQGYEPIIVDAEASIVSYQVTTHLKLNSQWIPEVEKVLNNQNPYTFELKYFSDTSEYFDYISDYNDDLQDQNKNDSNYQIVPLSNFTHWEPFTSLIQKFNLNVDKWLLIPQYVSTQGTYFKRVTGGTTWANLLQQLYPNKGSFPYFDGYYGLYMNYLKPENFIDGKMSEYEKYQTKHQELWSSLYKQFPSILLEQKYQNEDATNSLELLQMAKLAMQDFNNIEREYNITTIDTFALKGYEGQQINIGDSIALNAEELYTGFDDIKESLKQYLFVTDINYTLRQDTDVNLTVNKIKYQDKMIQQLAKLIK